MNDQIQDLLGKANMEFCQDGREIHSVLLYREYLRLKPSNGMVNILYSSALFNIGRLQTAYDVLMSGIKIIPKKLLGQAYSLLGEICQASAKYDMAEEFFRKALPLEEGAEMNSLIFLGATLAIKGDFGEAKRCYENALDSSISRDIEKDAHLNIGLILRTERKYEEAKAEFLKSVKIDKSYVMANNELRQLESLNETLDFCEKLELFFSLPNAGDKTEESILLNAVWKKISSEFDKGGYIHVVELGGKYCEIRQNEWGAWALFGDSLKTLGKPVEGKKALLKALRLAPKSEKSWVSSLLADLHKSYVSTEEAEKWYKYAIDDYDGPWGKVWIERGKNFTKMGKFKKALECFENALDFPEENQAQDDIFYNMGCVLRGEERFEEAKSSFLEAFRQNPNNGKAKIALDGLIDIDKTIELCREIKNSF